MDLADQIDDYICTFEGVGDLTADMLAMFIFVWAVLALFLIWLCKFLHNKYVTSNNNKTEQTATVTAATATATAAATTSTGITNKLLNNGEKRRLSEPREIVSSKEIKDLSSKSLSGGFKSGSRGRIGGGSGSGYIPPTPPIRKRLTRMSPGPELRSKTRSIVPPSNVVGPETTSVTWTSQVFRWLYSDLVIVNELLSVWVQALNNSTSKAAEDHGIAVEIVRILPDSPAPSLQNIFCHSEDHDPSEMVISCDCDAMPVLQIRAVRQKSGKMETHHYKTTISRFRARLSAPMNYNTLKGEMKIEGYPDIRIVLNSVGAVKPMDQDEQHLQDIITEILTNALRDTIYPIDFSIYSTCPRAPEIHPENFFHLDQYNTQNQSFTGPLTRGVSSGKRLLVKILKGEGLIKAKDPYCVIEMDEPPQKNQTGARQGTDPYWDEHFLFDLSPQSAEILFEVYDRPENPSDSPRFLGLGLVGIDELAVGPASSQILTLQPRPYETEQVNGAIMVEFVFIEGAEVPAGPRPYKLKEALKISTPMINEHLKNGSNLADAAVKALQEGALGTSNGQPSKSTLIIHSVQRVELNKDGQIEMNENIDEMDGQENIIEQNLCTNNDNNNESVVIVSTTTTTQTTTKTTKQVDMNEYNQKGNNNAVVSINGNVIDENESFGRPETQSSPYSVQSNGTDSLLNHTGSDSDQRPQKHSSQSNNNQNEDNHNLSSQMMDDERGRSRKKRDFFGTIKRRFGKSKTRSKSFDRGMIPIETGNLNGSARSISADRENSSRGGGGGEGGGVGGVGSGVTAGESGTFSNNTSPGRKLILPTLDQSRRSSLSESSAISGFSSASAKTYLHEASTLVLETIENGIKRHFLVPLAIAQRPRWRRKGTKLHIYNDHTFIAKHLSGGGLICAVCTKSIPRRPGKQGYECRDCQLICHKQCHVRTPQACPNPTVLSMELSKLNSISPDKSIRKV